jgi:formylglycine-generating enzyme
MNERVVFPAILIAALSLSALLLLPRFAEVSVPDSPAPAVEEPARQPTEPAAASSAEPSAAAAPPEAPAGDAPAPAPEHVRVNPESAAACPGQMVLVDGVYCPFVGHRCKHFLDEAEDICGEYSSEPVCEGRLQQRRYCIDIYEYPNVAGVRPVVMVDYGAAERACRIEGKRLCTAEEWEFACEGTQMWPYPHGLSRDAGACNIDKPVIPALLKAFAEPWKLSEEVARLDRRAPSGSMPQCVSPFGVHDMTGNVDEWVENTIGGREGAPYRSTLKGGFWGRGRSRCRTTDSSNNEWYRFYQTGFRCCAGAKGGAAGKR